MYKKRYGASMAEKCPFCHREATARNSQKVPVCERHRKELLREIKCLCGSALELKTGKYGPFFNCLNCGNISLRKALTFGSGEKQVLKQRLDKPKERTEITVRSDDQKYFEE